MNPLQRTTDTMLPSSPVSFRCPPGGEKIEHGKQIAKTTHVGAPPHQWLRGSLVFCAPPPDAIQLTPERATP